MEHNSINTMNREIGELHATMKQNHELHSANALKIEKIADTTTQILVQAKATNGRVTSLEKATEKMAVIISRQDGFILETQRKLEEAIHAGEIVRQNVNELTRQRKEQDAEVKRKFAEAQEARTKIHWLTIAYWENKKNMIILILALGIIAWIVHQTFGFDITSFLIKLI